MRLIDADRLKETIHTDFSEHFTLYHDTDQTALMDMVMDDIDEMPTAFDNEKVIEQLNRCRIYQFQGMLPDGRVCHFSDVIEIVEKGGIE